MAHKYYPWIAAALVSVMLFAGCGKKAGDTSSADSSGVTKAFDESHPAGNADDSLPDYLKEKPVAGSPTPSCSARATRRGSAGCSPTT